MANFFINRPVFAWVIAIMLMMAGALSITNLPVAQYRASRHQLFLSRLPIQGHRLKLFKAPWSR